MFCTQFYSVDCEESKQNEIGMYCTIACFYINYKQALESFVTPSRSHKNAPTTYNVYFN